MKKIIITLLALSTVSLYAGSPENRPAEINCKVSFAPKYLPKKFAITALNTNNPEWSVGDAGLVDELDQADIDASGTLKAFFSNECDNGYEVIFKEQDLIDLKNKKVRSVKGVIEGGQMEVGDGKRKVTCK